MTKTKFENPSRANKKKIIKSTNLSRTNQKTPRFLSRTNRKNPRIQFNHAFNFFPEPDNYCFQIPDNYMDKENFPEDAEIKELFISDMLANGFLNENLIVGELNGICKEQHALTRNLQMQTTGSMVLYIENNNDVKAAATIRFDFFEKDYEEDEEDEEDEPYKIELIRILTFCSKQKGYGTKLMNKIIGLFFVGIDNGYILDNAKIVLNYTVSSKPFYKNLGFDCTDIVNNFCFFHNTMVNNDGGAGRKQNARKTKGRKTKGRKTKGRKTTQRRSKK